MGIIKSLLKLRPKQFTLKTHYYILINNERKLLSILLKDKNPSNISNQFKNMIFLQLGNPILPCLMTQLSHFIQAPAKPTSHNKAYGHMAFSQHKTKRKVSTEFA